MTVLPPGRRSWAEEAFLVQSSVVPAGKLPTFRAVLVVMKAPMEPLEPGWLDPEALLSPRVFPAKVIPPLAIVV